MRLSGLKKRDQPAVERLLPGTRRRADFALLSGFFSAASFSAAVLSAASFARRKLRSFSIFAMLAARSFSISRRTSVSRCSEAAKWFCARRRAESDLSLELDINLFHQTEKMPERSTQPGNGSSVRTRDTQRCASKLIPRRAAKRKFGDRQRLAPR
ncbi:MAG: hypothetical protein KGJ79_18280 [Alphaproteobacteria bacterium]|nr:hypothetical protein [Alphaproteobacteria bacterium]MDE2113086.1 hypothetical protein [Alphaproteobacteria bacterium]MDE2492865.1 hypothetical protein [Alphaproteobacteria bacterium]